MRFLHTADWHLGRQFHHVSLIEDQAHVLNQLTELITTQSVDAVIIAGDIYDRPVPPAAAITLLDDTLHHWCQTLGVPVILISGNHDSAGRLRFGARHMHSSGLHILADLASVTTPISLVSGHQTVDFYGIPYSDPREVSEIAGEPLSDHDAAHTWQVNQIKAVRHPDRPSVLISHCFVAGGESSDSERLLSVGGADSVSSNVLQDFTYVALGHLHAPQTRGADTVRYSGSLLKYSFSEQHHKKGVTLVDIDTAGAVSTEHLALYPKRNVRVLEGFFKDILAAGQVDPHRDDYVLVRLMDKGAILNAMAQLRDVYPNTLHLEKPGIMTVGDRKAPARDALKRGEAGMFRDFYQAMTGEALSDAQAAVLEETLSAVSKAE